MQTFYAMNTRSYGFVSGFMFVEEETKYAAAEKSVKQALHQLSHLQKVWQCVLPTTVFQKAIGENLLLVIALLYKDSHLTYFVFFFFVFWGLPVQVIHFTRPG